MSRSKSSARWLERHISDPYVRKAQLQGFASRAAFKLVEIQQRDRILRPGITVVDLGAAPGGWSQIAAQSIAPNGRVIAVDILPFGGGAGIEIIQGDFRTVEVWEQLQNCIGRRHVDLILSDMAPNLCGISDIDQARMIELAELVLRFAFQFLAPNGILLIKFFQGPGAEDFIQQLRPHFTSLAVRKPPASRSESREIYLLGKNFARYTFPD